MQFGFTVVITSELLKPGIETCQFDFNSFCMREKFVLYGIGPVLLCENLNSLYTIEIMLCAVCLLALCVLVTAAEWHCVCW